MKANWSINSVENGRSLHRNGELRLRQLPSGDHSHECRNQLSNRYDAHALTRFHRLDALQNASSIKLSQGLKSP